MEIFSYDGISRSLDDFNLFLFDFIAFNHYDHQQYVEIGIRIHSN